jgi:DNA-binding NarL/FixJ family response regulator
MSADITECSRDLRPPSSGVSTAGWNGHRPSTVPLRPADSNVQFLVDRRVTVAGTATTVVEALAVALASQGGFAVTCAPGTGPDLFRQLDLDQPEVVVLYLPRREASLMEGVGRVKSAAPNARLVLLVAEPDVQFLARAAANGVAACLSLDTGLYDLVGAINAKTTGTMVVGASSLSQAGTAPHAPATGEAVMGLTPRELEVLALLVDGCSVSTIASRLVISIYTARGHVKNVLRKLGAHSQLEAVAIAGREGLLCRSEPGATEISLVATDGPQGSRKVAG